MAMLFMAPFGCSCRVVGVFLHLSLVVMFFSILAVMHVYTKVRRVCEAGVSYCLCVAVHTLFTRGEDNSPILQTLLIEGEVSEGWVSSATQAGQFVRVRLGCSLKCRLSVRIEWRTSFKKIGNTWRVVHPSDCASTIL